jgi:hypothetical protein
MDNDRLPKPVMEWETRQEKERQTLGDMDRWY